jgi:hypothetical protein
MTFQEYDKRLGSTIRDIQNNQSGAMMVKLGMSALTAIKQRVQETGVNAKGQKYPAYSTKPTLVGCKTFVQKNARFNLTLCFADLTVLFGCLLPRPLPPAAFLFPIGAPIFLIIKFIIRFF